MSFEKYFSASGITGKVQQAVAERTAEALTLFCKQSAEFRQAVEQSGKSFQQCLDSIDKTVNRRSSVSDFEVFKAAAEFYFTGAVIHFDMRIDLGEDESVREPEKKTIAVSFDDLLDF
ncbi:MAG: hypothetical protein IJ874_09320 [Ruminococcus sp.]|nr:hypothetical protein [Ruminococcus sp.]